MISLHRVLTLASLSLCFAASATAQDHEIFRIGKRDNSFTEFSRGERVSVVYRVGESSPENDWPSYQPGTFDELVGRSTMQQDWVEMKPPVSGNSSVAKPFQIVFSIDSKPKGTFTLHLNAIFRYRRPAAPLYVVYVNGNHAGSFRLAPHPAPELWWPNGGEADGNTQFFGYQSLDMILSADLFREGSNILTVQCTDGFGIHYDSLSLRNNSQKISPTITDVSIEPTVFYKRKQNNLIELANLRIRTSAILGPRKLKVIAGGFSQEVSFRQKELGDVELALELPASDSAFSISFFLEGFKAPIYQGTLTPKRKWNVFALPMEQADFGYNDLPARTLEWENRFIDKALVIQKKYPSYAFTLDAAANLESYMATRQPEAGNELLSHLRSGKFGMNAVYANFFTGLATAEELFRTLEYSQKAGKKYGFKTDSASQTDEPSITWAMPQILASAGIKYFSNGSDPIRGALNPIGLLNFRSPFYWESPTGSKVLMWSGISYTAVDDMTWGGWNEESVRTGTYQPSILGLYRSLPLFLSQYERQDFPFDAVLLFGLHNDEIPLRHWGDADVLEMWNKEFAFPRVIPGTQKDFFSHVTKHFEKQIPTIRGDGGAYWEDEAGADAKIAASIRASQSQIAAAEKFDGVGTWLLPHLRRDDSSFDDAWKNILLADSYVWSDANSYRRPYSYRTRFGEAAHRAWANAAQQQTSDLRLVAMDKIADQIQTNEQGFVVFNSESWARSDFFDAELELDEALFDVESGNPIACSAVRLYSNYQDVRCWASNVPATGYRFYAIRKGRVQTGTPVALNLAAPEIENRFYKIQVNAQTGAVQHLIDKSTGLDLADPVSPYGINEYLYVTGGDPGSFLPGNIKDNRILAADVTLPLPELQIHHPEPAAIPEALQFAWGTVIITRSKSVNTPEIVSTIALPNDTKRIDFSNVVSKAATLKKEAVYFSFPFRVSQPQVNYQGATAWVNPEKDMLPGANRQWFTTQGGVWTKSANTGLAWSTTDAPLITLEDINRGLWPDSIKIQSGHLFSYAMNNYWYTDAPAQQGGQFTFRYALTSDSNLPASSAMTLAAEQRSPLIALRRYNMGWKQILPSSGAGFLNAYPAGVNILTIRPLAAPDTYLIRVHNSNSEKLTAGIEFPLTELQDAFVASNDGEKMQPVNWKQHSIDLEMERYEIKNVVVRLLRSGSESKK